jgi:hypothetical protein
MLCYVPGLLLRSQLCTYTKVSVFCNVQLYNLFYSIGRFGEK